MNSPHYSGQMHYFRVLLPLAAAAFALLASACSGSKVIPPELEEQIDSSVSFRDIQASPQALQGRTVLLGGEVLGARRLEDGVELEVLQLPVKDDDPPVERRTESRAGFSRSTVRLETPRPFLLAQRSPSSGRSQARRHAALTNPATGILSSRSSTCTSGVKTAYRERSRNSVGLFGGVGFGFGSGGRGGSFGGVGSAWVLVVQRDREWSTLGQPLALYCVGTSRIAAG